MDLMSNLQNILQFDFAQLTTLLVFHSGDSQKESFVMMEETKGMVMSLQTQIDTLEALKAGKFPELPAAAEVKVNVVEPVVKVVEVTITTAPSACSIDIEFTLSAKDAILLPKLRIRPCSVGAPC